MTASRAAPGEETARTVAWALTPQTAWPLRVPAYGGVAVIGGWE